MATYKISHNVECTVNEKGEAVIQPVKTDFFYGNGFPNRMPPGNLKKYLPSDVVASIQSIKFNEIDTIVGCSGFPNLHTVEFCGKVTAGVERTIGVEAFANCKKLKNVIGLETVNEIGPAAFENTGLTGVITLENHQRAEYYSFANTNIEGVILKGGILYPEAFGSNPNLKDVKIGAHVTIFGDPFKGSNPNIIAEAHLIPPHFKNLFDGTIGKLRELGYNVVEKAEEERPSLSAQIESVEAEDRTSVPDNNKVVINDTPSLNTDTDTIGDGDR